jgi:outer membrane murein-binding lipoprotein Lpp
MSEDPTKRFDGQENGEKLTQILTIVQNLDARLRSLEQKVEQRLYDTRPIWEKVQTDIAQLLVNVNQLQSDVNPLREGQEFLRSELHEIHTLLRDIFRRLSIFNDTLVTMQADYRDIYDRVRDIERQRT